MGVWGPSGGGKTFQIELCCKLLRIEPIVVSAAELEDEIAGEPGRRLRSRYIAAGRAMAQSGVPSCLVIDDADAGFGKYEDTQRTVNSQIVAGTLMALCDDPHRCRKEATLPSIGRMSLRSHNRHCTQHTATEPRILPQSIHRRPVEGGRGGLPSACSNFPHRKRPLAALRPAAPRRCAPTESSTRSQCDHHPPADCTNAHLTTLHHGTSRHGERLQVGSR